MAEILAPCGSPEALEAAIRTGCNAVYLGGESFSARQNAANFSETELEAAVRRCHISGVKVYQAINTLITDKELPECIRTVRTACRIGVDGLITQDLALAVIVRELCPGMEIHASTQMTLHTEQGMLFAKELGFSRAVAARELPGRILRRLCSLPIETEVFVHGALCMSVSGQCYMSAVIGQRSANRGLCAQACRLPASCVKGSDRHGLSLKDMSHIPHLRELEEMGAASLKIEGRMKRPEYVAAAVTAVRSELAGESFDYSLLEGVFSRSGFTDGYFTGKTGSDMFGFRRKEDVEASSDALPALRELYRREYKRSKVEIRVQMHKGEPGIIKMTDENGLSAEVCTDPPQEAVNRPADVEFLKKQLSKLGDTVYEPGDLVCSLDDGIAVPASMLNAARRELCRKLDELRYEHFTKHPVFEDKDFAVAAPSGNGRQAVRLCIADPVQLKYINTDDPDLILSGLGTIPSLLDAGLPAEKLCAVMPRFTFDENKDISRLKELSDKGIKHIECTNYAHIRIGRELGLTLHGGFGLNVTNSLAMRELKNLGLADCTVSFELKAGEIAALGDELKYSVVGYGRLPMMMTVNCPIRAERGCKACTGAVFDRTGRRFPVRCSKEQGYVELLNSDILCIADRKRDLPGADSIRIELTDETPERAKEITDSFKNGEKLPGEGLTKGLYYRGVK